MVHNILAVSAPCTATWSTLYQLLVPMYKTTIWSTPEQLLVPIYVNCSMVHTIPGTKLLLHDSKHSICGILSQQTGTQNKCRHLCRAVLLKQIKHSVGKAGKSWAEQHATWGLVQMQQALVQVCHKSLQIDQTLLVSYTTTSPPPSLCQNT